MDFALQFQVDGDHQAVGPGEAAGNDGVTVEQEDGSNVVSVDFGKKK